MNLPPSPNPQDPIPPRRRVNPFKKVPVPIPLQGRNLRAADIFKEGVLDAHLERNAEWIQGRPRTTTQIDGALFPDYSLEGMHREEVLSLLNHALYEAGFTPDDESSNPTWTFTQDQ